MCECIEYFVRNIAQVADFVCSLFAISVPFHLFAFDILSDD